MSGKRNFREQLELEKQKNTQLTWEIVALREEIRAAKREERVRIAREILAEEETK